MSRPPPGSSCRPRAAFLSRGCAILERRSLFACAGRRAEGGISLRSELRRRSKLLFMQNGIGPGATPLGRDLLAGDPMTGGELTLPGYGCRYSDLPRRRTRRFLTTILDSRSRRNGWWRKRASNACLRRIRRVPPTAAISDWMTGFPITRRSRRTDTGAFARATRCDAFSRAWCAGASPRAWPREKGHAGHPDVPDDVDSGCGWRTLTRW